MSTDHFIEDSVLATIVEAQEREGHADNHKEWPMMLGHYGPQANEGEERDTHHTGEALQRTRPFSLFTFAFSLSATLLLASCNTLAPNPAPWDAFMQGLCLGMFVGMVITQLLWWAITVPGGHRCDVMLHDDEGQDVPDISFDEAKALGWHEDMVNQRHALRSAPPVPAAQVPLNYPAHFTAEDISASEAQRQAIRQARQQSNANA